MEERADEIKLKVTYEQILTKIDTGEILVDDLGTKILNRLQVVDTMMNLGVLAKLNRTLPKFDFLDVLNEFDKEIKGCPDICFELHRRCNNYITEVLTPLGLCRSFNIALAHDLLNLNTTSDDFHYELFSTCFALAFNFYDMPEFPRNDTPFPTGLHIEWFEGHSDFAFNRKLAGRYMFLHDPYELPSTSSKKIMINANYDVLIQIIPQINRIDDSIAGYDPVDRNCYLETEKTLKFFKKYTKANCIQECLTDFMINRCSCVEFFMIRNSTTRVCSANEKKCTEIAKDDFDAQQQSCGCLQPCNYVKYGFELVEKGVKKRENAFTFITFEIKFDQFRYNPIIWKEQFDILDFFSYFGGLLGLLAGISVLSIGEGIYWITTRLLRCRTSLSSTLVTPLDETLNDNSNVVTVKVGVYVLKYLEESSIHGLRYLLDRKIMQRLLWTLIITISGIGCFFMILETRNRVPDSRIVAFDDNLKDFGYVDMLFNFLCTIFMILSF
ncbi:hypothetical protein ACKWTF_014326 [Chironomus riparius]